LALARHEADARHRSFEGLFVWADVEREGHLAVATRVPRDAKEGRVWVAQSGVVLGGP